MWAHCWRLRGAEKSELFYWVLVSGNRPGPSLTSSLCDIFSRTIKIDGGYDGAELAASTQSFIGRSLRVADSGADQREQSGVSVTPAGSDSLYPPRQRCRRRSDSRSLEIKKKEMYI